MFTYHGKEITEDTLKEVPFRIKMLDAIYHNILTRDDDELSLDAIMHCFKSMAIRDAMIYAFAREPEVCTQFLEWTSEEGSTVSEGDNRSCMTQTLAVCMLLNSKYAEAKTFAEAAIRMSESNVGLSKLLLRAFEQWPAGKEAEYHFRESLKALTIEEIVLK